MKIAVYSLCRDRIEYTQHCFTVLHEHAGYPFHHFVIDNGSQDGTADWLYENAGMFHRILTNDKNLGISKGEEQAIAAISASGSYELLIKFDNDCEVETKNILTDIVEFYELWPPHAGQFIVSPRVSGIVNQPSRNKTIRHGRFDVGITDIVGGLFRVTPIRALTDYPQPTNLPLAWGQDDRFCTWASGAGYTLGYLEDLHVNHYETTGGQVKRYPEYFERKWREESTGADGSKI